MKRDCGGAAGILGAFLVALKMVSFIFLLNALLLMLCMFIYCLWCCRIHGRTHIQVD